MREFACRITRFCATLGFLRVVLLAIYTATFFSHRMRINWLEWLLFAVGEQNISRSERMLVSAIAARRGANVQVRWRMSLGDRPHYDYIVLHAAMLADRLGYSSVTVIEFGVAGGNGLAYLESVAAEVQLQTGVQVHVLGFDSGTGMPPPEGYRDMPYYFAPSSYSMNREDLFARLREATVIFGLVEETVPAFQGLGSDRPIGAVVFDLDYYSSTVNALKLLQRRDLFLPRVQMYFDNTIGNWLSAYSEGTGELAAIADFNRSNQHCHIALSRALMAEPRRYQWHQQIFVAHLTSHPEYSRYLHGSLEELPLEWAKS